MVSHSIISLYRRDLPEPNDAREELEYPIWARNFLGILADTGNIGLSCEAAGIAIQTYRRYRFGDDRVGKRANAQFAHDCNDALDRALERLRLVATKRATAPGGSDKLLIMLLKAHDPDLYNPPRVIEHHEDPQALMRIEEMRTRLLAKLVPQPALPPGTPDLVEGEFREENAE